VLTGTLSIARKRQVPDYGARRQGDPSVSEKIFAVIAGAKPGAKLKKVRNGYGAAIVG
jgi:NAD-dependent DNA ligase